MNRQQGLSAGSKLRQQGAVAVIVALCLVVLVGVLGLVLDLGHLYITKTELQNAADASALSGAERLDGTLCRVNSSLSGCSVTNKGAVQFAVETAGRNSYGFNSVPVTITIADLWLGNCPDRDRPGAADTDGCTMVAASSIDTAPEAAGLTFLKVDTGQRTLNTWFARIWSILQTQTYAMAVAGRYVTQITPVAVCAIDNSHETQYVSEDGSYPRYIAEWGFRRGTSYEIGSINVSAGVSAGILSGDQLYVHPTAKSKSDCQGNPPDMVPYLCGGKSTLEGLNGSVIYANTGLQSTKSKDALNTRFGATVTGCEINADTDQTLFTPAYADANWMNYTIDDRTPTQSVIVDLATRLVNPSLDTPRYTNPTAPPSSRGVLERAEAENGETGGCSGECGDNYGVLWSNYRPLKKLTSTSSPVDAVPADWPSIYRGGPTYGPATTWASRYTGNKRRVINTLIVNCGAVVGNGSCAEIPVLGVGEFFIQTEVNTTAGTNIYAEFGGIVSQPLPSAAQIRLYR